MHVLVGFDRSCVITVLPECPLTILALIVLQCSPSGDELHALSNDIRACVFDQKMNVIACQDLIEHTKSKALFRFKKPVEITAPIARKLE